MTRCFDLSSPPGEPPLIFPGCAEPTIGVELEVSLVNPRTRALEPRAPEILSQLGMPLRYKPELFRTIIELNTDVCRTVKDVRRDMGGLIAGLQAVCRQLDLACFSTGTHPIEDWRHVPLTDDARYQDLVERLQWPARRLLICGLHVHIGMKSGEHAIAVMNAMRVFLPHLLALSASSPYWHGIDTGLASCRSKVFEGLPTAGLPPQIANWNEFVSLMRTLMEARAISTIREIWWDIRPHTNYGTLELRVCDGVNTLDELCAITAFVQCLVVYLQDLYDRAEPLPHLEHWTLRENKWRAVRCGIDAEIIRDESGERCKLQEHVKEWIEELLPTAQRLQCEKELLLVNKIFIDGPNAERQRRVFEQTGALESVVDALIAEFANH